MHTSGTFKSQYVCHRVQPHLRSKHWMDLWTIHSAELTHELVLHESHTKNVLAKLEAPAFIHTYIPLAGTASTHTMLFELPRYSLEFENQDGQLLSLEYKGYRLSPHQQLVTYTNSATDGDPVEYTLPEFKQYLLLQRITDSASVVVGARRADSLVLVSVGGVVCNRNVAAGAGSAVEVKVDECSSTSLKVRTETGIPRFEVT